MGAIGTVVTRWLARREPTSASAIRGDSDHGILLRTPYSSPKGAPLQLNALLEMVNWLQEHQGSLYWMGGISVVLLIATLIGAYAFVVRLPPDYLRHKKRPALGLSIGPIPPSVVVVGKNVLGYLCILGGLAMLVLPGPGLVVALVGFLMVDFPGKYPVEKWLLSRPRVLKLINWVRRRGGRQPLRAASRSGGKNTTAKLADAEG